MPLTIEHFVGVRLTADLKLLTIKFTTCYRNEREYVGIKVSSNKPTLVELRSLCQRLERELERVRPDCVPTRRPRIEIFPLIQLG